MKLNLGATLIASLITSLLTLTSSLSAQSTGTIAGKVTDSSTNLNLEGVIVSIKGTALETYTDGAGEYSLRTVPAGAQMVQFTYVGLNPVSKPVSVAAGERSIVDLDMAQQTFNLDELQVFGNLIGQSRAINLQKTSSTLKSVVASDAFGRFPDQNAAEILGRLPGVSVELDQGEGRYVIVRGIDPDLSNVSIDGVAVPSPESSTRRVALDVIPSDILDTLEVTKTVTPDMDGDTIGGNVNIKTKSAFDYGERVLQGTVQAQYSDLVDDYSGKINLTYGDVFNNGTVGWITSVSYQERDFGSDNNEVDGPWDEEDGGYFAPEIEFREYVITRERLGISTVLEFKPEDDSYFYVRGIYNEFADQEFRYRTEIKFDNDELDEYEIVSIGDRTASVLNVVETDRDVKDRYEEQNLYSISAGGEITRGDWDIDFQGSFSHAEESEPNRLDSGFRTADDEGQNFSYDFRETGRPVVTYDGGSADPFDPSSFAFDGLSNEFNETSEEEFAVQINARREMEIAGKPGFIKVGAKYRSKTKESDLSLFENDDEPLDFDLSDFAEYSPRFPYFNDPSGLGYLRVNAQEFRRFFESNRGGFAMEMNEEDSTLEDYESNEDILAAYFMAGMTNGDWDWTAGVRIEHTEFDSTGLEAIFDEEGDFDADASFTESASKDYTNILPGIHGKYTPDESQVFRVSINKSLARPKFSDSANRRVVDLIDGEEIIQGNPELYPYQAWNLDLSYEYYLPSLGVVSVSGFAKKIDDFIFLSKTEIPNPEDPGSEVDLISPLNGDTADIFGLEFAYSQPITAVDGLSVYSNLTFIDSQADLGPTADRNGDLTVDFPGTSDLLGTIALSYEFQGFFIRLAGTYRSEYLQVIGGEPAEDEFIDTRFQWDVSTSYTINDHITFFAEFVNIDDEPLRAYYGESSRLRQYEEYSWAANVGVKWNL